MIAGYFDDLITINTSSEELCIVLGFAIHPSKSQFILTQKIECIGFVIDSVSMLVPLSNNKKKNTRIRLGKYFVYIKSYN